MVIHPTQATETEFGKKYFLKEQQVSLPEERIDAMCNQSLFATERQSRAHLDFVCFLTLAALGLRCSALTSSCSVGLVALWHMGPSLP